MESNQSGYETSFVQTAIDSFLGPFTESYIFVTKDARKNNWEKICQAMEHQACKQFLAPIDIPDGKNQSEIWDIFAKLTSCIETGDVVVVDVTHSFRSIPILTLACIQYMRSLESVQLERIVYGAWEAREPYEERYEDYSTPPEAPIFDLTPFVELMDWSHAISEFTKYGQIEPLKDLVKKDGNTLLMDKKLRKNLSTVVDQMTKLQNEILTCRGKPISNGKCLETIIPNIKILKKNDQALPRAFQPLLEKLESKLIELAGPADINVSDEVRRGFGAVSWCLSHGLIQQAYTIFQESLITHFCKLAEIDCLNKKRRALGAQAAKTLRIDQTDWISPAKDNPDIIRDFHNKVDNRILDLFERLSTNRNDINHADITSANSPENLTKKIAEVYADILRIFSINTGESSQ